MNISPPLIHALQNGFIATLISASVFTLLLLGMSLLHLSRTGPQIRDEVLAHYRGYLVFSLARLTLFVWVISVYLGLIGNYTYLLFSAALSQPTSFMVQLLAGAFSIGLLVALRFMNVLWHSPAILAQSFSYANRHLVRLWKHLSERGLHLIHITLMGMVVVGGVLANAHLLGAGNFADALLLDVLGITLAGIAFAATWLPEPKPQVNQRRDGPPNIVMIGSDTLRADRLGVAGYARALTPCIDKLAQRGAHFTSCYVPCARTAPSLLSLFTGCWPHTHGIRDNFISDEETKIGLETLPQLLKQMGYRTATISDWCGTDLHKFPFGFEERDLPADQWNLKFLLRQGPKDLRLFLSLFCHNRFGKYFLPEIYYLAGVPLNRQVGWGARNMLRKLTKRGEPFFLNVFMGATHPPFGSEHPYYSRYADPAYTGESKFVMAKLTDPFEIIQQQAEPKETFDLDQIIDLYDGCVNDFDDQVSQLLTYLDDCQLTEHTIVVIYSDHGFEFFEYDTWGQGNSAIGDVSARVPLVMAGPGIPAQRVAQIVRSVDIAPTLLALAGGQPAPSMEGTSLLPCFNEIDLNLPAFNETGLWLTRLPGTVEGHLGYPNLMELLEVQDKKSGTLGIRPEYRDIYIRAKDRMLREGNWKLVYQPLESGPLLRLFDLQADPDCRHDAAAANPEITSRLWAQLQAWMQADQAAESPPCKTGTIY